jgi:hypothetical protein
VLAELIGPLSNMLMTATISNRLASDSAPPATVSINLACTGPTKRATPSPTLPGAAQQLSGKGDVLLHCLNCVVMVGANVRARAGVR